jgi:hypothetical protein
MFALRLPPSRESGKRRTKADFRPFFVGTFCTSRTFNHLHPKTPPCRKLNPMVQKSGRTGRARCPIAPPMRHRFFYLPIMHSYPQLRAVTRRWQRFSVVITRFRGFAPLRQPASCIPHLATRTTSKLSMNNTKPLHSVSSGERPLSLPAPRRNLLTPSLLHNLFRCQVTC